MWTCAAVAATGLRISMRARLAEWSYSVSDRPYVTSAAFACVKRACGRACGHDGDAIVLLYKYETLNSGDIIRELARLGHTFSNPPISTTGSPVSCFVKTMVRMMETFCWWLLQRGRSHSQTLNSQCSDRFNIDANIRIIFTICR